MGWRTAACDRPPAQRWRFGVAKAIGLAAASAAFAAPPTYASAPVNNGGVQIESAAPGGVPREGDVAFCDRGSWNDSSASPYTYGYDWLRNGQYIGVGSSSYLVQPADVGQSLQCAVHASNGTQQTDEYSAAISPTAAPPTVHVTRNSPSVSGNLGRDGTGISVQVALERNVSDGSGGLTRRTVDQTPAVGVAADGTWTASFANHAPADDRDTLVVSYSGSGAPASAAYQDLFAHNDSVGLNTGGSMFSISGCSACVRVQVQVTRGSTAANPADALPDPSCSAPCSVWSLPIAGPPITLNDAVAASIATYQRDISPSRLVSSVPVGLPGQQGAPACRADLITYVVQCAPLAAGDYRLVRRRSGAPDEAQTFSVTTDSSGYGKFSSLTSGDAVDLFVAGSGGRLLTTIHAMHLRADIDAAGFSSGDCQADEWLGPADYGNGNRLDLCSTGGVIPAGASYPSVLDEFSGGLTEVRIPDISRTFPGDGDSRPQTFTAFADASYYAREQDATVLSTAPVELTMIAASSTAHTRKSIIGSIIGTMTSLRIGTAATGNEPLSQYRRRTSRADHFRGQSLGHEPVESESEALGRLWRNIGYLVEGVALCRGELIVYYEKRGPIVPATCR